MITRTGSMKETLNGIMSTEPSFDDIVIIKINKFQSVSIHCRMKASTQLCVGNKQSGLSTLLKGAKSVKAVASARIEPTTVRLVVRLNH